MKATHTASLLTTLLLVACSQAPSSNTTVEGAPTPAAAHAQTAEQSNPTAPQMAEPVKIASATGVVESVDATAGKIVLAHGAIEALGWPAMTMAFKATPEQISSVHAGQKVRFELRSQGMEATIAQIEPIH